MQEFDIIKQNTVSVRGNFVEFVSIKQADGALNSDSAPISIRADGVDIGKLLPGESLRIERIATRWEITAENYAKVKIGVGGSGFSAARGTTFTEVSNKSLRGTELHGSVRTNAVALNYQYCGLQNITNNKVISISELWVVQDSFFDYAYGFCELINPVYRDALVNRHPQTVSAIPAKFFAGSTVSLDMSAEMLNIKESIAYPMTAYRSTNVASERSPLIIPPGMALFVRALTADKNFALRINATELNYGPR